LSVTYQVYILQKAKGRFYVGHTDDLDRRLSEHDDPDNSKSQDRGES